MERLSVAASQELQQLVADAEIVTPEQVVERARDEASALHRYFEWDDSAAAHEYRIVQARRVLRLCVTVTGAGSPPLRALVSLSSDRAAHGGYRPLQLVLANPEQRAVLLQDALEQLAGFQEKYERLRELAELWPVADKIVSRHGKRSRR